MEGMMGMMKGNVAMMVPQSLRMGWINAFFSGYVISMRGSCEILGTRMLEDEGSDDGKVDVAGRELTLSRKSHNG